MIVIRSRTGRSRPRQGPARPWSVIAVLATVAGPVGASAFAPSPSGSSFSPPVTTSTSISTRTRAPSGGPRAGVGACRLGTAPRFVHADSPLGSESWAAGVHRIKSSITIPLGATVTVPACSRLEMGRGVNVYVEGRLVIEGTAVAPVDVVPASVGRRWGAIWLKQGSAALAYTTISGGGGTLDVSQSDTLGSPLYVAGNGADALQVDHVTVEGARGVGVALVNARFVRGSTALTVHGAGAQPLYLGADALDAVPDGAYTGNAIDAIALQTAYFAAQSNDRPVLEDVRVRDHGVPYCVGMVDGADLVVGQVGAGTVPVLSIDAGVTLSFTRGRSGGGRLFVAGQTLDGPTQALGAVVASGTAAKPVVFGSCEAVPRAGDWIGLRFTGADPRTSLDHVVIRHAGANSSATGTCPNSQGTLDADAALQVAYSRGEPATSFLTRSTISDSAANGVFRGWQPDAIDFLAGNTVARVAWCTQTWVPDADNVCPTQGCPTSP